MSDWVNSVSEKPEETNVSEEEHQQRIANLRQRLEQYNAAIAEAMNHSSHGKGDSSGDDTNSPRVAPVTASAAAQRRAGSTGKSPNPAKPSETILHPPGISPPLAKHSTNVFLSPKEVKTSAARGTGSSQQDSIHVEEIGEAAVELDMDADLGTEAAPGARGPSDAEKSRASTDLNPSPAAHAGSQPSPSPVPPTPEAAALATAFNQAAETIEKLASPAKSGERAASGAANASTPQPKKTSPAASSDKPKVNPMSPSQHPQLSLHQLENARFTIDLLNDTISSMADRHSDRVRYALEISSESSRERLDRVKQQVNHLMAMYGNDASRDNTLRAKVAEDATTSKEEVNSAITNFYAQCDSIDRFFEPIYDVQRRHRELDRKIKSKADELQHRRIRLEQEQRQLGEIESGLQSQENLLFRQESELSAQERKMAEEESGLLKRLEVLKKREERAEHWMRILENRDAENGEKEATLRSELAKLNTRYAEVAAEKENMRRKAEYADAVNMAARANHHHESMQQEKDDTNHRYARGATSGSFGQPTGLGSAASRAGTMFGTGSPKGTYVVQQSIIREDDNSDDDDDDGDDDDYFDSEDDDDEPLDSDDEDATYGPMPTRSDDYPATTHYVKVELHQRGTGIPMPNRAAFEATATASTSRQQYNRTGTAAAAAGGPTAHPLDLSAISEEPEFDEVEVQ